MGYGSYLKSPKMEEEQEVPNTLYTRSQESDDHQFMQGILGCNGDEEDVWEDFMDWDEQQQQQVDRDDIEPEGIVIDQGGLELDSYLFEAESQDTSSSSSKVIKSEIVDAGGFWDVNEEDDVKGWWSLKLNLNYQQVLDAWSDRGPLRAQGCPANASYMGEVPVMEEEDRTARREASVLRYKEKKRSRLFSKKIRYQVRKLNAEKRPRLKGRFVKRSS